MMGGWAALGLSVHLPCLSELLIIGAQLIAVAIHATHGMCFGHFPAHVVQVKCGSDSERIDMTTENLFTTGNSLVRRITPRAVPFVLAARKPNRPLPTTSLRVPVTPANRNYLRDLRHAELRAWQNGGPRQRTNPIRERVVDAPSEPRDLFVFGLIVALAMALAGVLLSRSPNVTPQCAHWVERVRQILG
jgi:hypothetical protein